MKRCLVLALGIFLLSPLTHAAPVTWTGGGGDGLWNTAKNWSTNAVPTASDDVTIGNFTVTANGDTDFANTVTCTGTFILNANMNIASTGSFTNITLMAGNIGSGALTITGPLTMSGGNILTQGNVTVSGTTTVTKNGTLAASGTVTNSGTINITGSGAVLSVGAVFINNGNVNIQSDSNAGLSSSGGTINNSGTIAKTMGSGTSILQATNLANSGTVSATTGTLQVLASGSQSGTFNADGTLDFALGNLTLNAGTTFGGAGTVQIQGGIWTLAADVTVNTTTFQLDGGGGSVTGGANNLIVNSKTVTWNSGDLGSSGSIGQVTIPSAATVVNIVNSGQQHTLGRNLDFFGTVNMNADLALGANITIEEFATFNIKTDNSITGTGNITNGGLLEKTGAGGTSNLSPIGQYVTVLNADTKRGTVTLSSGTLNFAFMGFTSSVDGPWTNNGTLLEFTAGAYNLGVSGGSDTFTISGSGTTSLTDATWNLLGDCAVDTPIFQFTTGLVEGGANLTINSPSFVWSGGNMQGPSPGRTTIPTGGTVTMSGSPSVNGRIIDNSGTVNFTSATNLSLASAIWTNGLGSTFTFQTDGNIVNGFGGTSIFENFGTLQKSGGSGVSTVSFNGRFDNQPGGKVLVGSGTLAFDTPSGTSGGGTKTSAFTANSGAILIFGRNAPTQWTLGTKTTMTGKGSIVISSGVWTLNAKVTVSSAQFTMTGGKVTGTSDFIVSSKTILCQAGSIILSIPGIVQVSKSADFISSGVGCTFGGPEIDVFGTLDATQGNYFLGVTNLNIEPGADVKVGDTFGFLNDGLPSTMTNQGTVEKPSGSGTSFLNFNGKFFNKGALDIRFGTMSVAPSIPMTFEQSAGTTTVSPGATLTDGGTFQIDGGSLFGGNIFGTLDNIGGNIQLPPGSLNLNAPLAQGSGSTTTETINGNTPGKFGQIVNSSSTVIGGQLVVIFGSGFSPSPSDKFPIETYSSASGNFSSVITPNPTCTAQVVVGGTAVNLQFVSNNVSVSINPAAVTLKVNTQQQFTDTVTNGCGDGVKWKVKEGAAGGKVTQKGLYTAPGTPGTFHVIVTSVADNTKSSTATVTVTAMSANKITVSPQAAVLQPGGTLHLQANTAVNWAVAEGVSAGSITSDGTFIASSTPGLYHVTASSTSDAAEHAVVNIAVVSGKLRSAYVANPDKNSVSVLSSVSSQGPATGQLQELELVTAGRSPAALAISPDGKYLAAANHDSNDVSMFAISNSDGTLHRALGPSMDTGTHPSAIAFDSAGRIAFVTNHDSDDISVFAVNGGRMIPLGNHSLAAGDQPSAITVHPASSLLFVTNSGSDTLAGFTYDAAGMLSPISGSPFATGSRPSAAAIDPAGKFLFIANRDSGDVSVFAIDVKNKTLQESAGSPFKSGKGAAAMAIDVTGTYLFVAGHNSNDVTIFQIDGESGALMLVAHTPLQSAGPVSMAMDPSDQYLYVTSDKTGGVTTLKLDVSTGTLTPGASSKGSGRASAIVVGGSTAAAKEAP